MSPWGRWLVAASLVAGALFSSTCGDRTAPDPGVGDGNVHGMVRIREDALSRARVWRQPAIPIDEFDFSANPPGGFAPTDDVQCVFTVQKLTGRTPKFHCRLPDGRVLKVKYGGGNGELQAEIAGTRLLRALGFPADDIFVVRSVRCAGCPALPFPALICNEKTGIDWFCFAGAMDERRVRTFAPVIIERRIAGTVIEAADGQGWSWFELERVDPARGGAPRAEIDALRLLAVVLAHWDNKGENQRLVCPEGKQLADGGCGEPIAMIQDLGATFGPERIDLHNWRAVPVWTDRATCKVSMEALPYGGATFEERRISEEGRRLLAALMDQLTDEQLTDLFTAARFTDFDALTGDARDARAWANVLREKITAVKLGGPCA
jgi:hypothetical protein